MLNPQLINKLVEGFLMFGFSWIRLMKG